MATPTLRYVEPTTPEADLNLKPEPVEIYDLPGPAPTDPVVEALIAAGFGTAGQVLATNSTGDGFEWVTPA